jgi:Secretion system C-terminal sorting domain
MKHLFTIFLVSFCSLFLGNETFAQELNVISAGGNYTEGASFSMSWTIGEAIIFTGSSGNNDVTQGFHQPELRVLGIEEYQELDISVYPNPARENINIVTSEQTKMTIYDIQGKIVETLDIYSSLTSVDVSNLSRGTYTLVFEANGTLAKRMKIVIL